MNNKKGIFYAVLAAALYAISSPLSKILLNYIPTTLMAGFLYIGAGIGMLIISIIRKIFNKKDSELKLSKKELPFVIAMILLDIAAPICLLFGLKSISAENASLLNNFEIVATAIIALIFFKEKISFRLWIGIIFVTIACMFLSIDDISSFKFTSGSLLILLACLFWGIENNCTKKLSLKDPQQIVILKGIFSGLGSLIIGLCIGEKISLIWAVFAVIIMGFIAYGLSIFFYVYAQRILGAAKTSAFYSIAPFIATIFSLIIFKEIPGYSYFIGLFFMIIGAILSSSDKPLIKKVKHDIK